MRTTASATRHHGSLLHEPGEARDRVGIRARQHSVAEVEDVARPPGGSCEDVARLRLDAFPRPEQRRRVEVALYAAPIADERPPVVERDAPIEADHVTAG